MVEEVVNSTNKPKNKTARPRPVYLWNVLDVQKWLRRHCSDYYQLYHEKFLYHDITGRVLLRINENILLRLGIDNEQHRMDIWREIMKLHLKTDMLEIKDIERRNNINFD
ncbi:sterile alpha motif domain-containing protein aveugle [Nomia melanderi]|uniref:sterile alpha motif domain-containing protein aveugle n=1 Tax=Nomia melanderi TaxID=2448451 RepID=UPI001303FB23|nr:protein aveugle [Nomia melanderi]